MGYYLVNGDGVKGFVGVRDFCCYLVFGKDFFKGVDLMVNCCYVVYD